MELKNWIPTNEPKKVEKIESIIGTFDSSISKLIKISQEKKEVIETDINGIVVYVFPTDTLDAIRKRYQYDYKNQSNDISEGMQRYQENIAKQIEQYGEKKVILLEQFQELDFTNYSSILNWISQLQEVSEYVKITKNESEKIVDVLEKNGFKENEHANVHDTALLTHEEWARNLIGQSINHLKNVGSVHPLIKSMIEKWRLQ